MYILPCAGEAASQGAMTDGVLLVCLLKLLVFVLSKVYTVGLLVACLVRLLFQQAIIRLATRPHYTLLCNSKRDDY